MARSSKRENAAVVEKGRVVLTIVIEKEDDLFAAHCPELGTASCGDTFEEAMRNIHEAILVDLEGLEQIGERESFFRERGIVIRPLEAPLPQEFQVSVKKGAYATREDFPVRISA